MALSILNPPQNNSTQENVELSIITESEIVNPDEVRDIKFEEIITGITSEPIITETTSVENVILESVIPEIKAQEPIVQETKVAEPIIQETKVAEPIIQETKVVEPKIEVDHPMVEVQNKVQEVIDVINTHVASKTEEAVVEIVKDKINDVTNDYVKDKIIIPFEKVAMLAARVSQDALLNLEQFATNGNHWWNTAAWIKLKAQLLNAVVYILLGILIGGFLATKYYEYRMDENTQLLSAMIYKGKIYDLKVRLQ